MSFFNYVHPETGAVIEREGRIGHAPKFIVVDGVRCERGVEMPARVNMTPFARGEQMSATNQLPQFSGFRDRDTVYRQWLNQRGVDYTPARRDACVRLGTGPTAAEQTEYARRKAVEAGAAHEFTRSGKPKATTVRGEWNHVARSRAMGDDVRLDR